MSTVYNIFNKIKLAGMILSGVTIFLMMLFIVADVTLRNLMNASILGSYEITEYLLMPIAFFPGLAYVYSSGIMPKIEMFVVKLKKTYQDKIRLTLLVLEVILFSLLTFYGLQYALAGTEELLSFSMKGQLIPYYQILYFIPIGFFLVTIEILFMIIENIKSNKNK